MMHYHRHKKGRGGGGVWTPYYYFLRVSNTHVYDVFPFSHMRCWEIASQSHDTATTYNMMDDEKKPRQTQK